MLVAEGYTKLTLVVVCPCCSKKQIMEWCGDDQIYFPVAPFCCLTMREDNSLSFDRDLDHAVNTAIRGTYHG